MHKNLGMSLMMLLIFKSSLGFAGEIISLTGSFFDIWKCDKHQAVCSTPTDSVVKAMDFTAEQAEVSFAWSETGTLYDPETDPKAEKVDAIEASVNVQRTRKDRHDYYKITVQFANRGSGVVSIFEHDVVINEAATQILERDFKIENFEDRGTYTLVPKLKLKLTKRL